MSFLCSEPTKTPSHSNKSQIFKVVWRDLTWDVSEPTSSLPSCSRHTGLLALYLPPLSLCSVPQACSSQTPFGHLPRLLPTLLRLHHPSRLGDPFLHAVVLPEPKCTSPSWSCPAFPLLMSPLQSLSFTCYGCGLLSVCSGENVPLCGLGRVGPGLCQVLSALYVPSASAHNCLSSEWGRT